MKISLLTDEPSSDAQTVATWYFNQWCKDTGRHTKEFVLEKILEATNRDTPPLLVVAKASGILVGAAELKIREMDIYPQYKFWIGGVYVEPNQRGKGIAFKLVGEIISRARKAGIDKLYLQTQDLSGGVYARQGFKPIEEADSKGVQVLVMVADLS